MDLHDMDAKDEITSDQQSESVEESRVETNSKGEAAEVKAEAPSESAAESTHLPRTEPGLPRLPRLDLAPWPRIVETADEEASAPPPPRVRKFDPLGMVAGLAAIGLVAIGALATYDHVRQSALVASKDVESNQLAANVAALKTRLDAIEAARSHEETAELHKVLGEIKSAGAAAQTVNATVAQLSARVDHIEKDQGARIDKLAEKIDHDASARFADIAARLDKIEKKTAPPAVAAVAPPKPAASPALPPGVNPANVSNEITGSIERPRPVLRGYQLDDLREGMALIDTRDGRIAVEPGDTIPGAGKVLRFERRGRDWAVITSLGVIASADAPY